jgi:glutamate dehydrogenase
VYDDPDHDGLTVDGHVGGDHAPSDVVSGDDVVVDSVDSARRMDEAKDEHLDQAIASTVVPNPSEFEDLVNEYYRHVSPDDILDRTPETIVSAVTSHLKTAASRLQGTSVVRAFTPSVERDGWSCEHTVIEVVTDDMPFLVDSVTGALLMMDRPVLLVIHPLIAVVRDFSGRLLRTLDVESEDLPSEAVIESWMHIEIERETNPADLAACGRPSRTGRR